MPAAATGELIPTIWLTVKPNRGQETGLVHQSGLSDSHAIHTTTHAYPTQSTRHTPFALPSAAPPNYYPRAKENEHRLHDIRPGMANRQPEPRHLQLDVPLALPLLL